MIIKQITYLMPSAQYARERQTARPRLIGTEIINVRVSPTEVEIRRIRRDAYYLLFYRRTGATFDFHDKHSLYRFILFRRRSYPQHVMHIAGGGGGGV